MKQKGGGCSRPDNENRYRPCGELGERLLIVGEMSRDKGIAGTIVMLAGPGVNKVVHYYERIAQISPVR